MKKACDAPVSHRMIELRVGLISYNQKYPSTPNKKHVGIIAHKAKEEHYFLIKYKERWRQEEEYPPSAIVRKSLQLVI